MRRWWWGAAIADAGAAARACPHASANAHPYPAADEQFQHRRSPSFGRGQFPRCDHRLSGGGDRAGDFGRGHRRRHRPGQPRIRRTHFVLFGRRRRIARHQWRGQPRHERGAGPARGKERQRHDGPRLQRHGLRAARRPAGRGRSRDRARSVVADMAPIAIAAGHRPRGDRRGAGGQYLARRRRSAGRHAAGSGVARDRGGHHRHRVGRQ